MTLGGCSCAHQGEHGKVQDLIISRYLAVLDCIGYLGTARFGVLVSLSVVGNSNSNFTRLERI